MQTVLRNHFCIYFALISLNNDFITHSECLHISDFKNNNKNVKKKPKNPQNKQTNPPFNRAWSFILINFGALQIGVDRDKFALIFSFVFSEI